MITIVSEVPGAAPRIVTMILRRLCRNVDVSPTRRGLRKFGSVRFGNGDISTTGRHTYRQRSSLQGIVGVSRATGKANLARAGLTARYARQHGVATAKSRRRAGCRVRSSGRRQSCGECDRANSHPAENGNRRGGACRMGLVAGNVIRCYWCECPGTNVKILRTRPHNIRKTA
jgi:hypothetical protein